METKYGLQPKIPFGFKSLAGFILIFVIWQGGALVWVNLMNMLIPATRSGFPSYITLLLSFAFLILGVFLITRYFFKIPFRSFLFEGKRPGFRKFAIYFSWYFLALILYLIIDIAVHPQAFTFHFKLLPWLSVFLVAAPLILFQCAAEEILFRGYLYRMFRSLKAGAFWSIFITSILFFLTHGFNLEMLNNGIWGPLYYLLASFSLGVVAYRTNGLAASTAIHFAGNLFHMTIWGYGASTAKSFGLENIVFRHTLDTRFLFFGMLIIWISYGVFQLFKYKRNRSYGSGRNS
ncbi:CAAX protease self-immunity [Thermoactinomyces sp. DSM 45891]|uniref:CPBP family intramembrane glutamic endopeptidase n=1 Tax=Thermoactinomyces sp. DSM 45891 TaxID=1761907 RepID=UPI00091453E7|nr:CPBP family intramembrane glutamic endopeptidase [Thermoactinomyces sp. DSM 45891]SFX54368.1 CAAX protease self-immunity [Thermoactinomyces sp. DSM 45891]